MEFEFDNVLLLKAIEKPYDFEGNKGIAYSATVLVEGSVFKVKLDQSLFNEIKDYIEKRGVATFELRSVQSLAQLRLKKFIVS